jgi:hypothetical protein
MRILDLDTSRLPVPSQPLPASHHARHLLSRRAFLGGTAGVSAAALGAGLLGPTAAFAAPKSSNPMPKPTLQQTTINGVTLSLTSFGDGLDPSSITDFNGFVGVADVQGTGTGTNSDGTSEPLLFDTDMRFMSGVYVAQDGRVHQGTFGFV